MIIIRRTYPRRHSASEKKFRFPRLNTKFLHLSSWNLLQYPWLSKITAVTSNCSINLAETADYLDSGGCQWFPNAPIQAARHRSITSAKASFSKFRSLVRVEFVQLARIGSQH